MKSFFAIVVVLIALVFGVMQFDEEDLLGLKVTAERISTQLDIFLYDIEIEFEGSKVVSEEALVKRLPTGKSFVWWMMNSSGVAHEIAKHPLLRFASAHYCRDPASSSMRCFRFLVEERLPALVAEVEGVNWIVDADGIFLRTLAADARAQKSLAPQELPYVTGISSGGRSPEMMSARLRYIGRALAVIEKEINRSITEVRFTKRGEMYVQIDGASFWVILDGSDPKLSGISTKARRLAALLRELRGKERLVSEIDLAYHKLGVVKLVEGAELGQSPESKVGE